MTSYYVNIAADKVDLALALEADRMRNLLLDPKEIDSERQVVMEERRTRTEDDPDGLVSEEMMSLAFKAHPYRWPVIGWMEDIRRIAPAELRAFYDTYYRPNNAILVVVGDVGAPEILGRVRRLFGRHRAGAGAAAGGRHRATPDRRATAGREEAERPGPDRERLLARAEFPLRGRAGARTCCRPSCPRDGRRASTGS